jgi:hypothetical protein
MMSHLLRLTFGATKKDDIDPASLNQVKMWIVPQKTEQNDNLISIIVILNL